MWACTLWYIIVKTNSIITKLANIQFTNRLTEFDYQNYMSKSDKKIKLIQKSKRPEADKDGLHGQ